MCKSPIPEMGRSFCIFVKCMIAVASNTWSALLLRKRFSPGFVHVFRRNV